MQTRIVILSTVICAVPTLVASAALAQNDGDANTRSAALPAVATQSPSGHFGLKSQLAISSDAGLSISHTSISGSSGSTTELVLRPALDYFLIDNLSLGGFLGVDYTSASGGSTTSFSIGPRVGYNVPFSERWSVWPKVGFSFASTSVKRDGTNVGGIVTPSISNSNSAIALNLFVPVMFHPVEHFFLGFGPALDTDLSGDSKVTTIAGRLTIGGWL